MEHEGRSPPHRTATAQVLEHPVRRSAKRRSGASTGERLTRFFELASDLLCVVSLEGHFVEVSRSWTTVLGWCQQQLLATPYLDYVHPDDVEATRATSAALLAGGNIDGFENRYRHRDGSHRWLRWNAVACVEEGLIYAVVRDVTEERRRQLLGEQLEQVTGVGTWELDLTNGVFHASALTRRLHGVDHLEQIDARSGRRFYPPEVYGEVIDAYRRLTTEGTGFDLEVPFRAANGTSRWVRTIARAELREGRVVRAYGTFQDVSRAREEREHLRHFQQLLDLSEEGILEIGRGEIVVYANQRLAAMAGRLLDEIIGGSILELIHPEDLTAAADWRLRLRSDDGAEARGELRLRRADGAPRCVQVAGRLVPDADGRPDWVVAAVTDIGELKDQQAALLAAERSARDSEERLQRVLTATQDGWWDHDLRSGERSVSARWCELHGMSPAAGPTTLESWDHRLHPEDHAELERIVRDLATRRLRTFTVEARARHAEGHLFPVVVRGLIEYDTDGHPARISGATTDVTAEHRAEQAQEQFVSTVSHELRTPLTSIGGVLEMLDAGLAGALPARASELLAVARRNTVRLRRLIDDLLDIEQLTTGMSPLERTTQPLSELAARSVGDHQPLAAPHGVTLQLCDADPTPVKIDAARIEQVLGNLLANAAKFAPPGSTVQVRVGRQATSVRCEVIDEGTGVPEDFVDQLFQRFAQADPSDPRSRGGTGLGLAISREIVERHGGRMTYERRDEHSVFAFELPAADHVG